MNKKRKKYAHGKCGRKSKIFRLPEAVIEKLERYDNQTNVVVSALDDYFMKKNGDGDD